MSASEKVIGIAKELRELAASYKGLEAEVEHWKRLSGQDTAVQQQLRQLRDENLALQSQNDQLRGKITVLKATLRANNLTAAAADD